MKLNWFINLEDADKEFIKNFVISSGSLKKLAKIYKVSYPTVRLRLNNIIEKINLLKNNKNSFEAKIMNLVIDDKLSLPLAKEIIEDYRRDKND